MSYLFPVTDKYEASEVTNFDFDISNQESLYTDLYEERIKGDTDYLSEIKYRLHLTQDWKLERQTNRFVKILFSGHRGSGKTTELNRFQKDVDNSNGYFSIFIQLENERDVSGFQAEELFVILTEKLIAKLDEREVNCKPDLMDIFTSHSSIVREKVNKNPIDFITGFNEALSELRKQLNKENVARDILFIVDGLDKINPENSRQLFVKESYLIRMLNVNMIFSASINSYYDVQYDPGSDFFKTYFLPVLRVGDESRRLLGRLICKRIDLDTFFGYTVLDFCIDRSGGCPRQLLRIVNKALDMGQGERITIKIANKAVRKLGQDLKDYLLDSEHIAILNSGAFDMANQKVQELLFSLALIHYNGARKINPLLLEPGFLNG